MSAQMDVEFQKFYNRQRDVAEKCHNGHYFEGFGGKLMYAICNVAFMAGANYAMKISATQAMRTSAKIKKGERN